MGRVTRVLGLLVAWGRGGEGWWLGWERSGEEGGVELEVEAREVSERVRG